MYIRIETVFYPVNFILNVSIPRIPFSISIDSFKKLFNLFNKGFSVSLRVQEEVFWKVFEYNKSPTTTTTTKPNEMCIDALLFKKELTSIEL